MTTTTQSFPFVTGFHFDNSVNPEFIAYELGHAPKGSANGALLAVRRVCDKGEIRRVFLMGNGNKVLKIARPDGREVRIFESADDAPLTMVDNVGGATRRFEAEIRKSIAATGMLPEELRDTFKLEFVTVNGAVRAIINWA